jgi:2-(1,2-epoxy-1,2-dihydrophenyl)acetyl-CoA isomerase
METVIYESKDGVATITLNRPDVLNALNDTIAEEITKSLQHANADRDVRCIVLTGAGRAFCAGADLKPLEDLYANGTAGPLGDILRERYNPMIDPLINADKPTIAAVNGVAAGAGASLALACDFRIASDKARFFQAFIKIGLVPDSGACFFLPRLVGTQKALELAMLGDIVDAEEALRIGLFNKVVPHDSLMSEANDLAQRLAKGPTRAYALTRRAILFGAVNDLRQTLDLEADLQQELAMSADHMEGVTAFLQKREPAFGRR